MHDLRLHFSNRQQADHPLFPGVHRVLRQPSGVLGIGDGLPGVLLAQVCLDRRGLWLQVPAGARGVHVNGRPVQRMAMLRAGDALYVDGVELRVLAPPPEAPPMPAAGDAHAGDPCVVLRGVGGRSLRCSRLSSRCHQGFFGLGRRTWMITPPSSRIMLASFSKRTSVTTAFSRRRIRCDSSSRRNASTQRSGWIRSRPHSVPRVCIIRRGVTSPSSQSIGSAFCAWVPCSCS